MDLSKVIQNLLTSLSHKLDVEKQVNVSSTFLEALSKKLHSEDSSLEAIFKKMATFGLDLAHINIEKVRNGEHHHLYFFLDVTNVLLDSIFQVKQQRIDRVLREKFESEILSDSKAGTSGGEEVSKILDSAKSRYGRINRYEPSKENVLTKKLPKFDTGQTDDFSISSDDTSNSSKSNEEDRIKKQISPMKLRKKKKMEREIPSLRDSSLSPIQCQENEINVNIPTSDESNVVIKLKTLDNVDVKNKRFHVRINQKHAEDERPSKSKKIVYGSKSIVSHHLRKTRPPMFSKRVITPKLDNKKVISRVIELAKQAKVEKENTPRKTNKERQAILDCQKIVREKRTRNAQLKKMLGNL